MGSGAAQGPTTAVEPLFQCGPRGPGGGICASTSRRDGAPEGARGRIVQAQSCQRDAEQVVERSVVDRPWRRSGGSVACRGPGAGAGTPAGRTSGLAEADVEDAVHRMAGHDARPSYGCRGRWRSATLVLSATIVNVDVSTRAALHFIVN